MDEVLPDFSDNGALGHEPPRSLLPTPNRVLVKEVNWLGDLVISLPALRTIRAAFATSKLTVMVKRELAGFFDGIGWVDQVIPYTVAKGVRGWASQWRLVGMMRAQRFDLAIVFPNSFRSALWVTMAGIPRRAGYATDGRTLMLNHRATPPADAVTGHQANYWLALVRETLAITPIAGAREHKLEAGDANLDRMRAWLSAHRRNPEAPLIAIAPAAAYGPAKEWPTERYAALIDLMAQRFGAEGALVGAPSERLACERVAAASHAAPLIAAGETSVGELIALLSLCDGFAGNDSGAMHLAAALWLPTVGIFGSTNPIRTGPAGPRASVIYHRLECSPCLQRTCRFRHYNCLRQTTPEEVADALAAAGAFSQASV